MMKACILSTTDMSRMTMVNLYTGYFDKHNIEYAFVYVDKYKDPVIGNPSELITYSVEGHENDSFTAKLLYYWKMRRCVKTVFDSHSFDVLVVWGSLTVFIFSDLIKKYFADRCVINIRDFFYNENWFVNKRMGLAMLNASFITISSDALVRYLPGKKFVAVHSLNEELLHGLTPKECIRAKDTPIRIMYIGWIGRLEYVYKLIDCLANDSRYELYFIGIGAEDVDKYLVGKNVNNVFTHGKFPPSDTAKYLQNADVIYNLYGYANKHFDTALSIKLYYAIFQHVPIMAFNNTYTLEIAEKCGIGYAVNPENFESIADDFYDFYRSLDQERISEKCDEYIKEIRKSNEKFYEELESFCQASYQRPVTERR